MRNELVLISKFTRRVQIAQMRPEPAKPHAKKNALTQASTPQ